MNLLNLYKSKVLQLLLICALVGATLNAVNPSWWEDKGAVDGTKPTAHNAPVLLGQFKHFVSKAKNHIDETFGTNNSDWEQYYLDGNPFPFQQHADDYGLIRQGQAKYVIDGMYNLLASQGVNTSATLSQFMRPGEIWNYSKPWTPDSSDDQNKAPLLQGQLKWMLSFDLDAHPPIVDSDGDGLSDDWEIANNFDPNKSDENNNGILDGFEDADGDQVSNLGEMNSSTDPNDSNDYLTLQFPRYAYIPLSLEHHNVYYDVSDNGYLPIVTGSDNIGRFSILGQTVEDSGVLPPNFYSVFINRHGAIASTENELGELKPYIWNVGGNPNYIDYSDLFHKRYGVFEDDEISTTDEVLDVWSPDWSGLPSGFVGAAQVGGACSLLASIEGFNDEGNVLLGLQNHVGYFNEECWDRLNPSVDNISGFSVYDLELSEPFDSISVVPFSTEYYYYEPTVIGRNYETAFVFNDNEKFVTDRIVEYFPSDYVATGVQNTIQVTEEGTLIEKGVSGDVLETPLGFNAHDMDNNDAIVGIDDNGNGVFYQNGGKIHFPNIQGGIRTNSPTSNSLRTIITDDELIQQFNIGGSSVYARKLITDLVEFPANTSSVAMRDISNNGNWVIGEATINGQPQVFALLKIDFVEDEPCWTLDDSINPPWMMIPENFQETVRADIPGLTTSPSFDLEIQNTSTASFLNGGGSEQLVLSNQLLFVDGHSPGETGVDLVIDSSTTVEDVLKIAVKGRRDITISIHAITENSDPSNLLVPNNVPTAQELQDYLNNVVWGKQANVISIVSRSDYTVGL